MELFIGKQLQVVVYSLILGLIFGGLYDIIRITHILCGIASYTGETAGMRRGTLPFLIFYLLDSIYMLGITAIFSFFLYWQMSGEFRLFVLLAVIAGFYVYYHTAGRLVMLCSEVIVRGLKFAALWCIGKPLGFLFRILRILYFQTFGRVWTGCLHGVWNLRTKTIRRKLKQDIGFY